MLFTIISSIVNFSKIYPALSLILITLLPVTELRASIPYGIIGLNYPWLTVFLICVITNIILGLVLYLIIGKIIWLATRIKFVDRWYNKYVEKTQSKIKKYIEKYGELGVAIFIGIPLPGSGVYTGSLVAYLIGLKYKKFILANIIGVLIAGTVVTIVTLTGGGIFNIFMKGL
ncbi:small multi-drug export protein [Candidatus Woesearchaeota archaeon]|nr:small multi-drug export protein [Candidatus Woesearchaeota archaeon]